MQSRRPWRSAPGIDIPEEALHDFTRLCVKNSEYDFVSGGHGGDYIDFDEFFMVSSVGHPQARAIVDAAVDHISALCKSGSYDTLAFLETIRGPVGLLSARFYIADAVGLPSIVVRPYKRLLSQAVKPFTLPEGAQVLIVTDVATTGRSITDAATSLWQAGVRRCGALAIADRLEGAHELLSSMDVPLSALLIPPEDENVVPSQS